MSTEKKNAQPVVSDPSDLCMYVISHKPFTPPADPCYRVLQVGFGKDLGFARDNTGENISQKNKTWCELTGLYWIWKNDTDHDNVGLCHYRRYFGKNKTPYSREELLKLLDGNDMLIAEFEPYKETVYEQYCIESGFAKDLDLVREIIARRYPQDVKAFDTVMKQGGISQYNMMACSKKLFDDYCSWLFSILEELESRIDLSGYNDYQKRIFGFLSERLLNVYVLARHLKVKRLPVVQTEQTAAEASRLALRRMKNRILFKAHHPGS